MSCQFASNSFQITDERKESRESMTDDYEDEYSSESSSSNHPQTPRSYASSRPSQKKSLLKRAMKLAENGILSRDAYNSILADSKRNAFKMALIASIKAFFHTMRYSIWILYARQLKSTHAHSGHHSRHHTDTSIVIVLCCGYLLAGSTDFILAWCADSIGFANVMTASVVCSMAFVLIEALAQNFTQLAIGYLFSSLFSPSYSLGLAYLMKVLPYHHSCHAAMYLQAAMAASFLFGPSLAAIIVWLAGLRAVFFTSSLIGFICFLLALKVLTVEHVLTKEQLHLACLDVLFTRTRSTESDALLFVGTPAAQGTRLSTRLSTNSSSRDDGEPSDDADNVDVDGDNENDDDTHTHRRRHVHTHTLSHMHIHNEPRIDNEGHFVLHEFDQFPICLRPHEELFPSDLDEKQGHAMINDGNDVGDVDDDDAKAATVVAASAANEEKTGTKKVVENSDPAVGAHENVVVERRRRAYSGSVFAMYTRYERFLLTCAYLICACLAAVHAIVATFYVSYIRDEFGRDNRSMHMVIIGGLQLSLIGAFAVCGVFLARIISPSTYSHVTTRTFLCLGTCTRLRIKIATSGPRFNNLCTCMALIIHFIFVVCIYPHVANVWVFWLINPFLGIVKGSALMWQTLLFLRLRSRHAGKLLGVREGVEVLFGMGMGVLVAGLAYDRHPKYMWTCIGIIDGIGICTCLVVFFGARWMTIG